MAPRSPPRWGRCSRHPLIPATALPATRPGTEGEGPAGAPEETRAHPDGIPPFCSGRHGKLGARSAEMRRISSTQSSELLRYGSRQPWPPPPPPTGSLRPGTGGPSAPAHSGCGRPAPWVRSAPRPGLRPAVPSLCMERPTHVSFSKGKGIQLIGDSEDREVCVEGGVTELLAS